MQTINSFFGGPGTEPPQHGSFFESEGFHYLSVVLGTILFIAVIRYIHLSNIRKVYRKKVYNHLRESGYDHITANKISKSEQTIINIFLELTKMDAITK